MAIPKLSGDSLAAVEHRGSHLQIIASAGSGKTEVVSQRVVSLLRDGVAPRSIVAFTFTEKAAAEMKDRIAARVEETLGADARDLLTGLYVGTIHAYCFRLLQAHVPRYEAYDVLDENRLNAFLAREADQIGVRDLDPAGRQRVWASINAFLLGLDVVENELLPAEVLEEPFRSVFAEYLIRLERYRLLSFGQQIVRTVAELEDPDVAASVHAELRHLIVDEYQDVNPAQERLIELLTGPEVQLCVVGDDDQAIYQWRGSDVTNIVGFSGRYPAVATFSISTNRRSRPGIVAVANDFASSIPGRLDKEMHPHRPPSDVGSEVSAWVTEYEVDEAGHIANAILDLNDAGVAFADIAVLVRSRTAYRALLDQFGAFDIPVQPGGRMGLFEQPQAVALGKTLVWLVDHTWRQGFGPGDEVTEDQLLAAYGTAFDVSGWMVVELRTALREWKKATSQEQRPVDLMRELYELLSLLGVRRWDLDDPRQANKMGTLARFSSLLADFEAVRRRSRIDPENAGEQVGATDRGIWYYKHLAIFLSNYATGAYDGFDGEPDTQINAVDVSTIHRAKGLEWPVVFVPSLTKNRFPNSKSGKQKPWPISRRLFNAARYEGSDAEERRLFYVAVTRARDWASISRHEKVTKNGVGPSPYWQEVAEGVGVTDPLALEIPIVEPRSSTDEQTVQVSYSELAAYLDCAMSYRLRTRLGFRPRLAAELGYGKAVHHVLRAVANSTKARGRVPTASEIDVLFDTGFFLPAANKPAHKKLKAAGRRIVDQYVTDHPDDLLRVWETERPFELHLDGVTVAGRADVILDLEDGQPRALAILDYKASIDPDADGSLQLQVYADAGRREGLDVRGAYIHDLKGQARQSIDVSDAAVAEAEQVVLDAADRLRAGDFTPSPGRRCGACEVRAVCHSAAP